MQPCIFAHQKRLTKALFVSFCSIPEISFPIINVTRRSERMPSVKAIQGSTTDTPSEALTSNIVTHTTRNDHNGLIPSQTGTNSDLSVVVPFNGVECFDSKPALNRSLTYARVFWKCCSMFASHFSVAVDAETQDKSGLSATTFLKALEKNQGIHSFLTSLRLSY